MWTPFIPPKGCFAGHNWLKQVEGPGGVLVSTLSGDAGAHARLVKLVLAEFARAGLEMKAEGDPPNIEPARHVDVGPPPPDFAKDAPAEIAAVGSMTDLLDQPAIAVAGDWKVRLGWADASPGGEPWELLYCWAEYTGTDGKPALPQTKDDPRDPLGPVRFRVSDPDKKARLEVMEKSIAQDRAAPPTRALYAAVVPVAWNGRYEVSVFGADGREVGRAMLTIDKPRPCLWQTLGMLNPAARTAGGPWVVMASSPTAVYPWIDGAAPAWTPLIDPTLADLTAKKGLPGQLPVAAAWLPPKYGPPPDKLGEPDLALSLDGGDLVVRSRGPINTDADLNLAARWWVNGEPVPAPPADAARLLQEARKIETGTEARLPLILPQALGRLKAGDKVGLQVLYSPAMLRPLTADRNHEQLEALAAAEPVNVPLLSNRLDFAVTEAMLKGRPAPALTGSAVKIEQAARTSDAVVVGTVVKAVIHQACELGTAWYTSQVQVAQVLKGELKDKEATIECLVVAQTDHETAPVADSSYIFFVTGGVVGSPRRLGFGGRPEAVKVLVDTPENRKSAAEAVKAAAKPEPLLVGSKTDLAAAVKTADTVVAGMLLKAQVHDPTRPGAARFTSDVRVTRVLKGGTGWGGPLLTMEYWVVSQPDNETAPEAGGLYLFFLKTVKDANPEATKVLADTPANRKAVAEAVRAAEKAAPAPKAAEPAWGEAVEGVQVRLRAEKRVWKMLETPAFVGDVRSAGKKDLTILWENQTTPWDLELDGKWYKSSRDAKPNSSPIALKAGGQVNDIPLSLAAAVGDHMAWQTADLRSVMREPGPGKHTVRVAAWVSEGPAAAPGKGVRVVSNPVEIEILPMPVDAATALRDAAAVSHIDIDAVRWNASVENGRRTVSASRVFSLNTDVHAAYLAPLAVGQITGLSAEQAGKVVDFVVKAGLLEGQKARKSHSTEAPAGTFCLQMNQYECTLTRAQVIALMKEVRGLVGDQFRRDLVEILASLEAEEAAKTLAPATAPAVASASPTAKAQPAAFTSDSSAASSSTAASTATPSSGWVPRRCRPGRGAPGRVSRGRAGRGQAADGCDPSQPT